MDGRAMGSNIDWSSYRGLEPRQREPAQTYQGP